MSTLPYASPVPLAIEGDVFRNGPLLVVRHETVLPAVCILCNAPAGGARPVRLVFTWDPSFKMTRETTLKLRQTAIIHAHLCPGHHRSWRSGRLLGIGGIVAAALLMGVSGIVAGISELSTIPRYTPLGIAGMMAAFVLLTVSMFWLALKTRTVSCRKIEGAYVHLEHAHPGYLERWPTMPE